MEPGSRPTGTGETLVEEARARGGLPRLRALGHPGQVSVEPAPRDAPPKMVAMPPAQTLHSSKNGYVINLTLSVQDCKGPVHGFASVSLPEEYRRAEEGRASYMAG